MARRSIIEIHRKPTAVQVTAMRTGLTRRDGIIDVTADQRTHEGIVGRGMADWVPGYKLGRKGDLASYCVLLKRGRDYLATLDAPAPAEEAVSAPVAAQEDMPKGAPEGTAERAAKLTREDVAEAVEDAVQWLAFSAREEARTAPASTVLAAEFKRAGAVMRRALKKNGPVACMSAIRQYENVTAALVAARRFERQTTTTQEAPVTEPTTPAAPVGGQQYGGITREDVTNGNGPAEALWRAGEFFKMYDEQHQAPAAAEGRTGEFTMPIIDHRHRPHVVIDGVAHRVVALRPAGARADAGTVAVADGTNGRFPYNDGTFETATLADGERVAVRVDGHRWTAFRGYQVRTEGRGHGIVAVYVKGGGNDIPAIERATAAYALAQGLRPGASAGGGEGRDGGATWISQRAFRRA